VATSHQPPVTTANHRRLTCNFVRFVNWLLLGHTEDMAEYARHRGLMETEAESVAYVVAGIVGFDTSAYSVGYIAGWADGDTDLIKSTAARVLRIAHQVATILARDENEDEAADENDAASGPS